MSKSKSRKLSLSRESVRVLSNEEARRVAGGDQSEAYCRTVSCPGQCQSRFITETCSGRIW